MLATGWCPPGMFPSGGCGPAGIGPGMLAFILGCPWAGCCCCDITAVVTLLLFITVGAELVYKWGGCTIWGGEVFRTARKNKKKTCKKKLPILFGNIFVVVSNAK